MMINIKLIYNCSKFAISTRCLIHTFNSILIFNSKGLHVTIFGSARAHLTKRERKYRRDLSLFGNGNRRTNDYHTVHYEGIEVYVNTRSYLFGKSGGPTFEMAPGTHRYEFTCQLPP
ncbi:hypothetical protein ACKWTF_000221 [Chironomus riparius]